MSQKGWGCQTSPWGCRWGGAGNSQTKMVDLHGLLWQEVGEVGRAARNQGEGKAPQPWKSPHRGSPATPWFLSRFPAG